ncbi:MAG: PTS sugar transporter subunit IIB, partial [bacterium]
MDVFLREIQFEVIKKWVTYDLAKRQIHYHPNQKEDSIEYIMESDNTYAKIVFHDECMIELALTNKKNGNVEFYLHFRLETMPHTLGLYREFMNTIDKIESQKTIRVLLSCTSGLTTSFFAETLIEAASSSHLDYEFSAVSYNELPEANAAGIYDIILLAPQISYQLSRVQSIFHRIPVVAIPSALFAKYDTRGTINLIEKSLKASSSAKQHTQLLNSASINYAHPALIIGVLSSRRHIRIVYRVYHHD